MATAQGQVCELPATGSKPGEPEAVAPVNDDVPTDEILQKVKDHILFDRDGKKHDFRTLVEGPEAGDRTLVVFVRQFYCGSCQDFVRVLSKYVTPHALRALADHTTVVLIGSDDPSSIEFYAEHTGCRLPVYAAPGRVLFQDLGMTVNSETGNPPAYIHTGFFRSVVMNLIWSLGSLIRGKKEASWANTFQNGGEFLFEVTKDGKKEITWCHRMRHTRDHTEPEELARMLGLPEEL